MIRPLRDEVERYGHYSLAAESMYDRPFQWGSKRTGPDLARVGGKYSDDWHRDHLPAPKAVVPGRSCRPTRWLRRRRSTTPISTTTCAYRRPLGVPYTTEMIAAANADLGRKQRPMLHDADNLIKRYPKAQVRDYPTASPRPMR